MVSISDILQIMGCACAKERELEEAGTEKETLSRVQLKAAGQTARASSFKTITRPLSASYRTLEVIRRSNNVTLAKVEYLCTYQHCLLKTIKKAQSRGLLIQKTKVSTEADRLLILDHPHIIKAYETLQDEENFYLVMESISGSVLQDYLSDGRFNNEAMAAKVMVQVFEVLCYCHQQGVIHGNINPQTVVIQQLEGSTPKVKLAGFSELDSLVFDSSPIHISHFRAPERSDNNSEKCDIWSCGVLIYLLLTGQSPSTLPLTEPLPATAYSSGFALDQSKLMGRSREVVSLLTAMLNPDPEARPTAVQCRKHGWIGLHVKSLAPSPSAIKRCLLGIKRARGHNPLQNAVMKFILFRILKEKELETLVEPFSALDVNSDGIINLEELVHGYARLLEADDALFTSKKVMEAADLNNSGDVSFSEFLVCAMSDKKLMTDEYLRAVFSCIDRTGTGVASVQELCSFFSVNPREIQLPRAELTFNEFLAFMRSANPS